MPDIDKGLIGGVIAALPLDKMITGPLMAMIQAQVAASKAYADFLMGVCIQDGKAVSVQFDYDETLVDEQGIYKGTVSKTMRIPLLAAISHPNITIEEGSMNGFGGLVMHHLALRGLLDHGLKFRPMTLPDIWIDQDSPKKQYDLAGLNAPQITAMVLAALGKDALAEPARA